MTTTPIDRPVKASVLLARHIVDDVKSRRLRAGDRLGSERDLMLEYDVSRATLREAVRILEVQGFVEVRSGPTGGPVVARPSSATLAATLSLLLYQAGTPRTEILAARAQLVGLVLRELSERRDGERIDALLAIVDALDAGPEPATVDALERELVETIAATATNSVHGCLLVAIDRVVRDGGSTRRTRPPRSSAQMYRQLLTACREGNPIDELVARWAALDQDEER